MSLAGINDRLELRVGEQVEDVAWQARSMAWLGRRNACHRRRLHELRRMGLGAGNTDRVKPVFLIDRVADGGAFGNFPIDDLIGEVDAFGTGERC